MTDVTTKAKCYTFACVECGLLSQSTRSDAITCSTACRVRANRNGSAEALRAIADGAKTSPGLVQRYKAIKFLLPDFVQRLHTGELEIDAPEVRRALNRAFVAVLDNAINERRAAND